MDDKTVLRNPDELFEWACEVESQVMRDGVKTPLSPSLVEAGMKAVIERFKLVDRSRQDELIQRLTKERDDAVSRIARIMSVITPHVIADGRKLTYEGPDIAERFAILSDEVKAAAQKIT